MFGFLVDTQVDGLAVINAQGTIMMVNNATLGMFSYLKGELEGKNVSVLMPQPWSSRHDSFLQVIRVQPTHFPVGRLCRHLCTVPQPLTCKPANPRALLTFGICLLPLQRYVESGQPHILNKTRAVVALHKDRSMFPLSLCVARLSGVGSDTLFIGVMRHEPLAGVGDDQIVKVRRMLQLDRPKLAGAVSAVRVVANTCWLLLLLCAWLQFWTTQGGTILCSDHSLNDALGLQPGDLVGRSFSNLCTDVDGVSRCAWPTRDLASLLGLQPPSRSVRVLSGLNLWQDATLLCLAYKRALLTQSGTAYRYIATAAQTVEVLDESGTATPSATFRTKMLHAFLPPVEVELSLQFGGHTDTGSDL